MGFLTSARTHRHLFRLGAAAATSVSFVDTAPVAQEHKDYHRKAPVDYDYDPSALVAPKQIINRLQYFSPLLYSGVGCRELFECDFGAFLGRQVRVFSLGKARAGIYLLVKSVVRAHKRGVILSPYTIPDVVNMVRFAGGYPIFVDNLPLSTNVDLDHLTNLVDPTVACVLVTHYHVTQNRLTDIKSLCRENDVRLFDDCALAIGAQYHGVYVGAYTDASVFSMSAFKALNYFLGGAITTVSQEIADAVSREISGWPELRTTQYAAAVGRTALYDFATRSPVFSRVTFPFLRRKTAHLRDGELLPPCRMNNKTLDPSLLSRPSQAAMWELRRKLPAVVPQLARRCALVSIYDAILGGRFISNDTDAQVRRGSPFNHYPIFVDHQHRDGVYRRVLARGFHIGLSVYPNVHEMKGFRGVIGQSRNVSNLVRSVLTLPTHSMITEEYASRLAYSVSDAISLEYRRRV